MKPTWLVAVLLGWFLPALAQEAAGPGCFTDGLREGLKSAADFDTESWTKAGNLPSDSEGKRMTKFQEMVQGYYRAIHAQNRIQAHLRISRDLALKLSQRFDKENAAEVLEEIRKCLSCEELKKELNDEFLKELGQRYRDFEASKDRWAGEVTKINAAFIQEKEFRSGTHPHGVRTIDPVRGEPRPGGVNPRTPRDIFKKN